MKRFLRNCLQQHSQQHWILTKTIFSTASRLKVASTKKAKERNSPPINCGSKKLVVSYFFYIIDKYGFNYYFGCNYKFALLLFYLLRDDLLRLNLKIKKN